MSDYIIKFDGEYRFLSNFWPCNIAYQGKAYTSSEHAYQAAKTLDDNERENVRSTLGANNAKKAGREVTLRQGWNGIKDGIMLDILRLKFSDNDLKEKLVKTEDKVLVEGNHWHDNYFGVCYCEKCKCGGKNRLGQLLMKVREEIQAANTILVASKEKAVIVNSPSDIPLDPI